MISSRRCSSTPHSCDPMPSDVLSHSVAVTENVRVVVRSRYLPEQSSPANRRYAFAYTVRLENDGSVPVQLRTRHWIITNAHQESEQVRGVGVVGQQPLIAPGMAFEYTSGCTLRTSTGTMEGSYQLERPDGTSFDATIAPFALLLPTSLN